LPASRDTPLILQTDEVESAVGAKTVSRSQVPDSAKPQTATAQPGALPGPPPNIQQANMLKPPESRNGVAVAAWVNCKPIFEDEIGFAMSDSDRRTPPKDRERVRRTIIDGLIDQELLYQDMVRRLEKQPKILEKYESAARKEVQRQLAGYIRRLGVASADELETKMALAGVSLESLKHVIERQFLSSMYSRGLTETVVQKITQEDLHDYYLQHINEYQQPDKVQWQNIFIAVGKEHPTLADARKFADQVLASWRGGADIAQLLEFDGGTARAQKGNGLGERRGEVRPRELEWALFEMKDGEFGQPLELPTGVHLYHLVHREYAGVLPFDERVQTEIDRKLKGEIYEKEHKRLVQELRDQAADRIVIVGR
jgi:peptidyl-prolyl cis-trans isomerase SurA